MLGPFGGSPYSPAYTNESSWATCVPDLELVIGCATSPLSVHENGVSPSASGEVYTRRREGHQVVQRAEHLVAELEHAGGASRPRCGRQRLGSALRRRPVGRLPQRLVGQVGRVDGGAPGVQPA